MKEAPVLILAYNRPDQVKGLVESLRELRPMKILVGIDGPKESQADRDKVFQVLSEIQKIDWTDDVEIRSRETNLGIRRAVPDSVSWAIEKYGETIVLEDDVRPGPEFFEYMNSALSQFRNSDTVGHISGYNVVPMGKLLNPQASARASIYPESYAWGTWRRSWTNYEDSLDWATNLSKKELADIVGSSSAAAVWALNFKDAESGAISTWAYRWVASLWKNRLHSISPNRNIAKYTGGEGGTHTRLPSAWQELDVLPILNLNNAKDIVTDYDADRWISKKVFRSTMLGSIRRALESLILSRISRKKLKK